MNCSNYEVHISGTSSPYSGRLEICYQNTWFGICSDYNRTTGIRTMKLLSPMLHATQWDILLVVKVKEYSASHFMKDLISHKCQNFGKEF